jgi:hypothetical protein
MNRLVLIGWSLVLLTVAACGNVPDAPQQAAPPPPITAQTTDTNTIPYLRSGQPTQGLLDGNVSAQLYAFNATVGDVVDVSVVQTEGSPLDPFLVVLNNAGGVVAADDNSGAVQNSASAQITIPSSGTYFVIATSPGTVDGVVSETIPSPSAYVVTVNGNTSPADQGERILYFRTELTVDVEPDELGYSSPQEPVYYYVFNAVAGQNISAIMTNLGSAPLDGMLALYDPGGNRIAVNDDAANTATVRSTTDPALEDITLPLDGTYLLMATDVSFYQLDMDTYEGGFFEIDLVTP